MVGREGVEPSEPLRQQFYRLPRSRLRYIFPYIHSFGIAENEELQLPTQIFNVERS